MTNEAQMLVPPSSDGRKPEFNALFDSLLLHDQLDDWIPDPVFYADLMMSKDGTLSRLRSVWDRGELDQVDKQTVLVPRDGGKTLNALVLDFQTRIIAHAVIASFAPRIRAALLRDKVGGFDYRGDSIPVFSKPGEGAKEIERLVRRSLLIGNNSGIEVIDITEFLRSARPDELEKQLKISGVRHDQTQFLRQVIQTETAGLPSVDDGFSFVYNYYLMEIDKKLANARENFFRFRDEYFVVSRRGRAIVEESLRQAGLAWRVIRTEASGDVKQRLEQRWFDQPLNTNGSRPTSNMSEPILKVGEGYLLADYNCETSDESDGLGGKPVCVTDSFEIQYILNAEDAQAKFLTSCASGTIIDGVYAVPVLRAINRARYDFTLVPAPLTSVPASSHNILSKLREGRPCLFEAMATAVASRQAWQVSWVAPLLADVGPLDARETTLMLQALGSGLGALADNTIRTALARASTLSPDDVLRAAVPPRGSFERRSMAVTAYFLARRGMTSPWTEIRERTKIDEPGLAILLERNLQ